MRATRYVGLNDRSQVEDLQESLKFNQELKTTTHTEGGVDELIVALLQITLDNATARVKAKALLERFGSAGKLLASSHEHLKEYCDARTIGLLQTVHLLMRAVLQEPIEGRPVLGDLTALYEYLRFCLAHENNELVRLLFLNSRNVLLKDELHCRGTINHTPVYPREIVKRAIQLDASALIIVHNHPSGDPSPSAEDLEMTRLLCRVLKDIGITLHDHIIVGKRRCESLRSLGYIG